MTWLAIGLAVVNACCFTVGTWLQHGVSADAPSLVAAVRRPRWLAGLVLLATGSVFQVIALGFAPVTVVEPAGVLGIVISVVLALRAQGTRLRWGTGCALAAILVGTGAFAVLAALNTVPVPISTGALFQAGAVVLAVMAACRLAGGLLRGRARCLVMGVGGGAAYGCTSTLVRAATEQYAVHGVSGGLLGTLFGLAAAILAGFWFVQRAYADGPPESTVAILTVVDPVVAVCIGIGVLGEAPGVTVPIATLGLACTALAVAGVVRLSSDVPRRPAFTELPHSSSFPPYPFSYDRTAPCPIPPSASSSARTPIRLISTVPRTSPTVWPPVSPGEATRST
ncbi:DMT family transporter [Microbispora sp. NPDC046933]|uniref:DMT family transporter n=1 Tax=Microbispora sp. NPDC046933 TaxID=3155618 RepID=UPI0033F90B2D